MASIVTRFAPSPNGYLHLGHAYSALVGWRAAQDAGGRFLLRIEDIDGGRSQAAAEHFAALGFRDVHNLVGGIDAWSQEIDPSVPRY